MSPTPSTRPSATSVASAPGSSPCSGASATADSGFEFHGYGDLEKADDLRSYFAPLHHSWKCGTKENTNGLIRLYLPKDASMKKLTQQGCDRIANELYERPRERLNFRTPNELFHGT